MRKIGFYCGLAALTAVVACVPSREPPPMPPPPQAPPPQPPPLPEPPPPAAADWRDAPLTPGDWRYRSGATGAEALFGTAASEPRFAIRCDRTARTIMLSRSGEASGAMTVRTSFGARALPLSPIPGALPEAGTRLSANDRLLDQIAFSRGRIAIETPGLPTLYVPTWPEPARVIEECRS